MLTLSESPPILTLVLCGRFFRIFPPASLTLCFLFLLIFTGCFVSHWHSWQDHHPERTPLGLQTCSVGPKAGSTVKARAVRKAAHNICNLASCRSRRYQNKQAVHGQNSDLAKIPRLSRFSVSDTPASNANRFRTAYNSIGPSPDRGYLQAQVQLSYALFDASPEHTMASLLSQLAVA